MKLLKAYAALDAMFHGKGTQALFASLGQQMITCDELCTAGFVKEARKVVLEAHAALVRSDWDARSSDVWALAGEDYEAVRLAMAVYELQMRITPQADLLQAELRMMRQQVASEEARRAA